MILEKLNVASYKGVRFHCNDTTTNIGRAKIQHRFANSNEDNIEDQGLNPRQYELTAIIFGTNYFTDRDQLLDAIESDGVGVLNHPFYGRIENAVAMPVSFDETIKRLGRTEIPITFKISDSTGIPQTAQLSSSGITNRKNTMINSVSQEFGETFQVTNGFGGNYDSAQSKLNDFANAIGDNVSTSSITSQAASSYRTRLDNFIRGINTLIGNPTILGQSMTSLLSDISTLYDTPEQSLDVARKFFTFGNNDQQIFETTAILIERANNNRVINETVKASSLSVAYEASGLIDFRTVDDVDSTSRALEEVYRGLKDEPGIA